jgi:glycosyltransferase involved in cell wall biosynthesis
MSNSIYTPFENSPIIGILLCTYNGGNYIEEQIASILNQSYGNWRLYVSDDGSSDKTIEKIREIKKQNKARHIKIIEGPKRGASQNFLSLVRLANFECEYIAFCDQDDIWYQDKLFRALNCLTNADSDRPVMYCTSTDYISENGNYLQPSYVFKNPPSFRNALVQSIAGGNTMVLNKLATNIIAQTPLVNNLIAHDWWAYIVITGSGGLIYYDPIPSLGYRQHSMALVGENKTLISKIVRVKKLLNGQYKQWNDNNLCALDSMVLNLTIENQLTLKWFREIRSRCLLIRLYGLIRSGVRRQTFIGNVGLILGVILNKV